MSDKKLTTCEFWLNEIERYEAENPYFIEQREKKEDPYYLAKDFGYQYLLKRAEEEKAKCKSAGLCDE